MSDVGSGSVKMLHPLIPDQLSAVHPADNIWLSASAGTGKTQVLSARVIRLLLEPGVRAENILCITFTKAGAAEMAQRINERLSAWVQMDGGQLFHELEAIGAKSSIDAQKKARELFAKVLDAPGGGLQILTIHSLCQSLLGSFPEEAGLVPGFKPVEGREQSELYREALSEMIVASENSGDDWLLQNLRAMSLSQGEEGALAFLKRCAGQPEAMAIIPYDAGALIYARRLVGVTFDGPVSAMLESACEDTTIDRVSILRLADMNADWGKGKPESRGAKRASAIQSWLALDTAERARRFDEIHRCWSKADGEPMVKSKGFTPLDDSYGSIAFELFQWTHRLTEQIKLADYADRLAQALLVGKAYSACYAESKRQRGLVDFDDMIRRTAALLGTAGMADWVRYKLDQQIDHILVDEAQDTNLAQWNIIKALSEDFFSGIGAKEDRVRTLFSVGDFKQAIYGFQGTDPDKYRQAGKEFSDKIEQTGGTLERLTLSQSFRSTEPVLDFVNAVIDGVGPERFGLSEEVEGHYSKKSDTGMIELFAPVTPREESDEDGDSEENWLTTEKRVLAHRIAAYVRRLVDEAPVLASTGKPLVAGDIMILLRTRSDLASSLVARLHAVNVPVAGIDRLKLLEPIAVQDLLACVRFVLQPRDDLSLACILVSPLMGWSQEQLLERGYRKRGVGLWQHLRSQNDLAEAVQPLRDMLGLADFTTPYHFLETILSGAMQGRKKMVARLGGETLVPIEELLNAALQFEQKHGGGLQAFLSWFESGDSEIKREGVIDSDEVRVMTVHGAKGLQSPVVILVDITSDPTKKPGNSAELLMKDGTRLPLLTIKSGDKIGRLAEVSELQEERDKAEHFRLLYVAMTRAEERLVMAGSLGKQSKGEAKEHSWYPALLNGMESLGCAWEEEPPWGRVMRYRGADIAPLAKAQNEKSQSPPKPKTLPEWLLRNAPEERRPPRPLVPSQLGDDDYGDAPASAAMRTAAEKGRLIHALFERLAGDNLTANLAQVKEWLARNNRDPSIQNDVIITSVRDVIENPDWQMFFGSNARAEVPLAAVVGETVITGRVDRLVIEPGLVRVLDFKTGRGVPFGADTVALPYLRQMAHYVAALETIFVGSKVEASLLFTYAPKLIRLPDEILTPHKPIL
jgi:ATP-dependent helicase/nuclease subunit A